jgi:PAS domain S-box-containing protein
MNGRGAAIYAPIRPLGSVVRRLLWIITVIALAVAGWTRFTAPGDGAPGDSSADVSRDAPTGWALAADVSLLFTLAGLITLAVTGRRERSRSESGAACGSEQAASRESGAFLQSMIDAINEIVIIVDRELRITHTNRRLVESNRSNGVAADVVGLDMFEALPFLPQDWRDGYVRVIDSGSSSVVEQSVSLNGEMREYAFSRTPIRDERGVSHLVIVIREITDAAKAKNELARRAERLQRHRSAIIELSTNKAAQEQDIDHVLALISRIAAEAMQVERVSIWRFEDEDRLLRCSHVFRQSGGDQDAGAVLESAEYPMYFDALRSGRAIDAHDARVDPRTCEFTQGYLDPLGVSSLVDAPIRYDGRVVGVVCFEHTGPARHWHEDEVVFAGAIADQAALALARRDQQIVKSALQQSEERFRRLSSCGFEGVLIHEHGRIVDANEAAAQMMGYAPQELIGLDIVSLTPPEYHAKLQHRLDAQDGGIAVLEALRRDGSCVPVEIRSTDVSINGDAQRVVVVHNITERIEAQEELRARAETERLLLRELDHRVRNNLAALLALVDLTRASASDVDGFARSIRSRVQTMATVHSMLARDQWKSVTLRELISKLTPPMSEGHISIEGPVIAITAKQAHALGLAVNELLTNSQKYGALSSNAGEVEIAWSVCDQDGSCCDTAPPCVRMSWREFGGPTIDSAPTSGLGTTLIEGLMRAELGGKIDFNYDRNGVNHHIEFHLDEAPNRNGVEQVTPPELS